MNKIFDKDEEIILTESDKNPLDQIDIWQLVILDKNSLFCLMWNFLEVISCIISTYMYGYMAAFGMYNSDMTENHDLRVMDIFFFVVFTISIIMNFFRDFIPEGETTSSKDLKKIAIRYLKGDFLLDFIAWIPFQFLFDFDQS